MVQNIILCGKLANIFMVSLKILNVYAPMLTLVYFILQPNSNIAK